MALAIWFVFIGSRRAKRAIWIQWAAIAAIVFGVYFGLRCTAHRTPPPPPSTPAPSTGEIPILVARAVAEYAGLVAAPVTLRMERDVRDQSEIKSTSRNWQTMTGLALIACVVGWWFWARRGAPLAATALVAGAVAYLPISNLFTLNATVAEHWLYVPSTFLFAALAQSLLIAPPRLKCLAVVLTLAWSVWLGVRTWQRQGDWVDQRTFLMRTIADGGDSARMRVNLGTLELKEDHPTRALAEYAEALTRNSSLVFAHFGRATAYARLGEYANARKALEQCAAGRGLDAEVTQLRAALDFAERQIDPAPAYKAAAELVPLNWNHRKRYLTILADSGRLNQAIQDLRIFLDTQPWRADSWLLLATFLERTPQRDFANIALSEPRPRDLHLEFSPAAIGRASGANGEP